MYILKKIYILIGESSSAISFDLSRSATYAGYVAVCMICGVILPGLTDPLHVDVSIEGDAPLGGLPLGDGSPGRNGG